MRQCDADIKSMRMSSRNGEMQSRTNVIPETRYMKEQVWGSGYVLVSHMTASEYTWSRDDLGEFRC